MVLTRRVRDARGWFLETFHSKRYEQAGIKIPFVQDMFPFDKNVLRVCISISSRTGQICAGVFRRFRRMSIFVARSFGQWVGEIISASNHNSFMSCRLPTAFAFSAIPFFLQMHRYYNPATECGIIFNDPDINRLAG
jgi:dTDP-4-dehydrorhamnose 3,5-epimerase